MRPARTLALTVAVAAVGAVSLWAQQFQFNLDHLAAKAAHSFDVSLNANLLQFAGRFLDGKDPDEAKVKKLIGGMEGIYVKSFSFKEPGAYTPGDIDKVRIQLKAPEWSRIVGIQSSGEN